MKSTFAALALLLAAGSLVAASEPAMRDAVPAAVIASFAQAIPPEPPVVGEMQGHQPLTSGSSCCRMNTGASSQQTQAGTGCACCRKPAPRTNAKSR